MSNPTPDLTTPTEETCDRCGKQGQVYIKDVAVGEHFTSITYHCYDCGMEYDDITEVHSDSGGE